MTHLAATDTLGAALPRALAAHAGKAFHFPGLDRTATYAEVGRDAARLASALGARGLARGELVALLFSTGPEFVVAFVGVLRAGGVVVPLPLPGAARGLDAYVQRLGRILRAGGVRHLLVGEELEAAAAQLVAAEDVGARVARVSELVAEGADGEPPAEVDPSQLALVQYTSGSTSEPKGVALTHSNVVAGLRAIIEGIGLGPSDVNGQWLPLHHDMGLIGMLAGTLCGVEHHLWSPGAFIRGPGRWLAEFARRRATIYAGPNFSYASMLAKVKDEELAALDLSAWRVAFDGAEVIDARATAAFCERFAAAGLRPGVMFPVYGLAEATLAVTFPALGAAPRVEWVDREALANARQVVARDAGDAGARGLVCVGRPVLGMEVRIADDDRRPLGARQVGEIEVRGPSVMAAYHGRSPAESGVSDDGWVQTGDLGFLDGGALFVCGRTKELIVVRGAKYYPYDVEAAAARVPGVFRRRAVAFSAARDGAERIVILAEVGEGEPARLAAAIREAVLADVGLAEVDVHLLEPRSIVTTTSGKYQRVLMRDRLVAGELEPLRVPDDAASPEGTTRRHEVTA